MRPSVVLLKYSRWFSIMPLRIVLCLIAVLAAVEPLQACSIPVFRYALERWAADLFEVSVFYEGPLPDAQMHRSN